MQKVFVFALVLSVSCAAAQESLPPKSLPPDNVSEQVSPSRPASVQPPASLSGTGTSKEPAPEVVSAVAPAVPPKPLTLALGERGEESAYADAIRQGDQETEKGDLPGAKRSYEKARGLDGKRAAAHCGLVRLKLAELDVAMDYAAGKGNKKLLPLLEGFRKAALLEKDAPSRSTVEYGRALLLMGDAEAALTQLVAGGASVKEEAEVFSATAVALLALGRGKESVAPMQRAAELDSGSAARQGNLGTVLLMQGMVKEATAAYQSAALLAPSDSRVHSDFGTALLASDQVDKAIKELREAVRLDSKRATYRSNLGYALQRKGLIAEAQAEYEASIRLDPKLVSAWINLATLLAQTPATRKRARSCLETAAKLDPTDPRVKPNLEELDDLERTK
jgi:Flp pilus assembly protein TadD